MASIPRDWGSLRGVSDKYLIFEDSSGAIRMVFIDSGLRRFQWNTRSAQHGLTGSLQIDVCRPKHAILAQHAGFRSRQAPLIQRPENQPCSEGSLFLSGVLIAASP